MAKGELKQYIITRFSIRLGSGIKTNPNELFDKDRLDTRFLIFERFCLPSVAGQTDQNFDWIILVDKDLPNQYRNKLDELTSDYEHFHIVTYDGTALQKLDFIEEAIGKIESKYVSTVRLDDDDALCSNFMQQVRHESLKHDVADFCYLSFPEGYHWKPDVSKDEGTFGRTYYPSIALGLSLVTLRERYPMTVFRNHTKIVETLKEDKENPDSLLYKLAQKSGDDISSWDMTNKLKIIDTDDGMYIRTIHGNNDAGKLTSKRWYNDICNIDFNRFSLDSQRIIEANRILCNQLGLK